ncbi:MAG: hypothetical protein ACRDSP_06670 [Pseudonocardiaceae bacterium]
MTASSAPALVSDRLRPLVAGRTVPPWFTTVELLGRPVLGADHPGRDPHEHTLLADRLWEDAGMPASRP